jgi:hypothetical protein
MAGAKIALSSTSGELKTDGNDNARVNLPTTATQAGYSQVSFTPVDYNNGTATYKLFKANQDGAAYSATGRILFNYIFNTTSTAFNPIWNTNATTMTAVATANYVRLNNSAITTTTTGVSMYSCRVFKIEDDCDLRIRFKIKHTNATASNKQAEFGLGYYAFGTGQAAAANEFIGFRYTTSGGFVGVLSESAGGAGAEQTININSNAPYSDNIFREYEVCITDDVVEYYANSTLVGRLARANDNGPILKSVSYPILMRVFNSGTASAAATFDVASVCVTKYGGEEDLNQSARYSLMGKSTHYAQPDILVASTNPHNFPASTTAPTSAVGSNTASVLNNTANLGGLYQITGTSISATVQSNVLVAAYQNPAIPTAAGAALNVRNLIVTSISLSPIVVGTVIVGGGAVVEWFAGIGATATSLATADANGTTAVAQKAPRLFPLSTVDTLAAAAAVGTVAPRSGDHTHIFTTPLVINPGEFLHIGFRTLQVTAAVTSGNYVGGIYVNGYWD